MDRFRNTKQPDWDWWGKLWPTPGETLRQLGVATGDSLVEIGSGNGYFALPAARITDPAPVYALDVDSELLAELERLAELQEIDNAVPVHGDARSLPDHLPEPVDVGLLANALHGVEEQRSLVDRTVEALADDGAFVVLNWRDLPRSKTTVGGEPRGPPADLRLSPAETRTIVEDATGIAETVEIDLPPYHYAIRFQR